MDAPDMENPAVAGLQDEADGWEWAVVEIFGHRRHAGRVREEERFGAKMLRIDVPKRDEVEGQVIWTTHYYGGSAVFSFVLTDEATVHRLNAPYEAAGRYLPSPDPDDDL